MRKRYVSMGDGLGSSFNMKVRALLVTGPSGRIWFFLVSVKKYKFVILMCDTIHSIDV